MDGQRCDVTTAQPRSNTLTHSLHVTHLMFQRLDCICSCCDWAAAAGMPGTDLLSEELAGSMLDPGRVVPSG